MSNWRIERRTFLTTALLISAGRRQLQPALEKLKMIQSTTPSTVIVRSAAHAIRQVTFKTRPYEELPPPEM
jgi:hypothetical protein